MTQYPSPQGPHHPGPYDAYGTLPYANLPAPTTPTSVTVLAIFAIILGGLGTLCLGLSTLTGLISALFGMSSVARANIPQVDPMVQFFGVASSVIELALSVVLLAGGIGALMLKPWARRALVPSWSVAMIVWAVIRLAVQIAWVTPATQQVLQQVQQQQAARGIRPPPMQFQSIMGGAMVGAAVVWFLVELAMPVCLLIFWRRPHVVAAFEGGPATPGNYGNP